MRRGLGLVNIWWDSELEKALIISSYCFTLDFRTLQKCMTGIYRSLRGFEAGNQCNFVLGKF